MTYEYEKPKEIRLYMNNPNQMNLLCSYIQPIRFLYSRYVYNITNILWSKVDLQESQLRSNRIAYVTLRNLITFKFLSIYFNFVVLSSWGLCSKYWLSKFVITYLWIHISKRYFLYLNQILNLFCIKVKFGIQVWSSKKSFHI